MVGDERAPRAPGICGHAEAAEPPPGIALPGESPDDPPPAHEAPGGPPEDAPPPNCRAPDDCTALWDAYARIGERLRKTAFRVLHDGHAAEDVVHDAILAARRNIHLLRDPRCLDPWLVRIARNTAASQARRLRRVRPDLRLSGAPDADAAARDPSLGGRLATSEPSAEAVTALREAVDALPEAWWAAFRERVMKGAPFDRIAREQGVTVSCVKTRISRVRSRLKHAIRT